MTAITAHPDPGRAWSALLRTARSQHGHFLTRQARRCGVSDDVLHRRRKRGELETRYRGVNSLVGVPETWDRRASGTMLAAGAEAALSFWSAAHVHGLLDVRPPSRLDVTFPRGRRRALPDVRIHDSRYLTDHDVVTVRSLRVTAVEWTICDLAGVVSERRLEAIVLDAWRRGLTDPQAILEVVARRPGFRGRRKLLAILERAEPDLARSRSVYESAAFVAIRDAGLPLPEVNYELTVTDGTHRILDLAYPVVRLDIELDSELHHSIAPDVAADLVREEEIRSRGWTVRRVRNAEIAHDPEGFVARVRGWLVELGHPALRDGT